MSLSDRRYMRIAVCIVFLASLSACSTPSVFGSASPAAGSSTSSSELSILGCPIHPAGTSSNRASADGLCTGQQIMAHACHIQPNQVDQQISNTALGTTDMLTTFGHDGVPYASEQVPFSGTYPFIVSCVDPAYPKQSIDEELYNSLLVPGDVTALPDWLKQS